MDDSGQEKARLPQFPEFNKRKSACHGNKQQLEVFDVSPRQRASQNSQNTDQKSSNRSMPIVIEEVNDIRHGSFEIEKKDEVADINILSNFAQFQTMGQTTPFDDSFRARTDDLQDKLMASNTPRGGQRASTMKARPASGRAVQDYDPLSDQQKQANMHRTAFQKKSQEKTHKTLRWQSHSESKPDIQITTETTDRLTSNRITNRINQKQIDMAQLKIPSEHQRSSSLNMAPTDGLQVLRDMRKIPGLQEQIFKKFSSALSHAESESELSPGKMQRLTQRLLYFYGPYIQTKNGISLYQAQVLQNQKEVKRKSFARNRKSQNTQMLQDRRLNYTLGQKGFASAAPGVLDQLMKENLCGKFNGRTLAQVLKVDQQKVYDLTKTITQQNRYKKNYWSELASLIFCMRSKKFFQTFLDSVKEADPEAEHFVNMRKIKRNKHANGDYWDDHDSSEKTHNSPHNASLNDSQAGGQSLFAASPHLRQDGSSNLMSRVSPRNTKQPNIIFKEKTGGSNQDLSSSKRFEPPQRSYEPPQRSQFANSFSPPRVKIGSSAEQSARPFGSQDTMLSRKGAAAKMEIQMPAINVISADTYNLAAGLLNHIRKEEQLRQAKKGQQQAHRNFVHKIQEHSHESAAKTQSLAETDSVSNSETKLKRRMDNLEMSRYKSVESKYLNQSVEALPAKQMGQYMPLLQRLAAKKPEEISQYNLKFKKPNSSVSNMVKLKRMMAHQNYKNASNSSIEAKEKFLNYTLNTTTGDEETIQPFQKGKLSGFVNEYENIQNHARARRDITGFRSNERLEEPSRQSSVQSKQRKNPTQLTGDYQRMTIDDCDRLRKIFMSNEAQTPSFEQAASIIQDSSLGTQHVPTIDPPEAKEEMASDVQPIIFASKHKDTEEDATCESTVHVNDGIVIGEGMRTQHVVGEEPAQKAFRIRLRSSGNVKDSMIKKSNMAKQNKYKPIQQQLHQESQPIVRQQGKSSQQSSNDSRTVDIKASTISNLYAVKNRDRLFTSVRAKQLRQQHQENKNKSRRNQSNDSIKRSSDLEVGATATLQSSCEIERPRTVQGASQNQQKWIQQEQQKHKVMNRAYAAGDSLSKNSQPKPYFRQYRASHQSHAAVQKQQSRKWNVQKLYQSRQSQLNESSKTIMQGIYNSMQKVDGESTPINDIDKHSMSIKTRSNGTSKMSQKVTIFKEGEDFMLLEAASRFCSNCKPSGEKNAQFLSSQKQRKNTLNRSQQDIMPSKAIRAIHKSNHESHNNHRAMGASSQDPVNAFLNESQDGMETNFASSQVSVPTRPSTQQKFIREKRHRSDMGLQSFQAFKQAEATYDSRGSDRKQPQVAIPPLDIQRTNQNKYKRSRKEQL